MKSKIDPWLSVVIPSYCGEEWLDRALESLVGEADSDVEVILVDGSPTSASRDTAAKYLDRLRLQIFERQDLKSWQMKTNFAIQNATAPHACWLGADDVWLPGRSASLRRWISVAPQAPLHLTPAAVIDKNGRTLGVWRCPLPPDRELPSRQVTSRLLIQNFVAAPAPVFRKDAWLACGGLDETLWYTADWDMWLKLASRAAVYYHDEVTVGFRIHAASQTMAGRFNSRDFAEQQRIVLERHLAALGDGTEALNRAAQASIAVNTALAAASAGDFRLILGAVSKILRLGPSGVCRYGTTSRICERAAPRIKARMAGNL